MHSNDIHLKAVPHARELAPIAVPDLHGRVDLLEKLLRVFPERRLVLLGDYTDRGPDSMWVLAQVRVLVDSGRAVALVGNHDLGLLDVILDGGHPGWWLDHGGQATIDSYTSMEAINPDARWMRHNLKEIHTEGTVMFTHAMRPDFRSPGVRDVDLHLWGRPTDPETPVHPLPPGFTVSVHGHTPLADAPLRIDQPDGSVIFYLDAGAYRTGRLAWLDCETLNTGVITGPSG